MTRFLSEAWFDAIAELAGPPRREGSPGITVQQVVTGTPDGDILYAISLSDERATVRTGRASHADVTLTEDYATAAAVARGEVTAQAALLAGRIRVAGNVAALMTRPEVVYDDLVPAAVRAATSF